MKTTLFALLWVTYLSAAGQTTLRGRVLDSLGQAIPFASVALFSATDSVRATTKPLRGTATDVQGYYGFDELASGLYQVRASAVGYRTAHSAPIGITSEPTDVPTLILPDATNQLQAVQVTARKPFVEQKLDRMVVNVAQSLVGSGGTALDVLEKAPGVTVDYQNERLQFRGKEGVIVQIDGRPTYLSAQDLIALLRSMASNSIDRIELITNPGARYDAAGNSGIIDIRLKKNEQAGTNGTVTLGLGTGRFDRERGGLQLNHRAGKLNGFGSYSLNRGGDYFDFRKTINQPDPNPDNPARQTFSQTTNYTTYRDLGQTAKVGFDWMPTPRTTIGLVWTGLWNDNGVVGVAGSTFRRTPTDPPFQQIQTDKGQYSTSQNQVGNLNVQHSFGNGKGHPGKGHPGKGHPGKGHPGKGHPGKGASARGQLSADVDVGRFTRAFGVDLLTQTLLLTEGDALPNALQTRQPTTIDILSAKADYSRPLPNGWKLETGLKKAWVRTDNDLSLWLGPSTAELTLRPDLSTRFQYTERVSAGYVSVSGSWGKTTVQAGLRAEHTHSTGRSVSLGQVVDRRYLNWFPSLFLSRPMRGGSTFTASYSHRIDRPNYQNLNPARRYIDPLNFRQGNAYLRPQFTHAVEVRYAVKNGLFAALGGNFTSDLVSDMLFVRNGTQGFIMSYNVGQAQAYAATLSWPITVRKGWQLQTTWLGYLNRYQFDYEGTNLHIVNLSGRLNGTNAFTFGKGWTAELTGWVRTPALDVVFRSPWQGSVDAGVQKSVSPALKLKLTAQDLFHSNTILRTIDLPTNRQAINIRFDTRIVLLNLTYSVGNQQLKASRQRRTASDDESRRAN